MKTINITSIVALIIYCSGCTKEANKSTPPIIDSTHHETSVVTSSDWFPAEWQYNQVTEFTRNAPELSNDLLKAGKVLVFGKGGFEMRDATALPATFDANYIAAKPQAGYLKFILQGAGTISNTLRFKYILIPSAKLAPANSLDYMDYYAVCIYYKISE